MVEQRRRVVRALFRSSNWRAHPEDAGKSSILGKRNWEAVSATPEPSTKKRKLNETSSKSSSKKSKSASRGRSREPILQFDDAHENPIPDSFVDENVAAVLPSAIASGSRMKYYMEITTVETVRAEIKAAAFLAAASPGAEDTVVE